MALPRPGSMGAGAPAPIIITNGDAAVARLRAAGMEGDILPWRDMLHDGPVPATATLEELSETRARFLAQALGLAFETVRADFAQRDAALAACDVETTVELWFEHDLYDQLQLIQLIHYFSARPSPPALLLVQATHYLGMMGSDEIHDLAQIRARLTKDQMNAGRLAFSAFTAPDPTALATFVAEPHAELPFLVPALRRLLGELPAPGSGLTLTEARILAHLAKGPATVAEVFAVISAMDEARFLADLPFFLRLDGLAFVPHPLIYGLAAPVAQCGPLVFTPGEGRPAERAYGAYARTRIALSDAGRAALAGTFDHARENGVHRHVGGTLIAPGHLWRYDRETAAVIAPA